MICQIFFFIFFFWGGGGGAGGPEFFCAEKKNGAKFHFFNFRKFLIKQTNIYQIPKCHTFLESSLHLVSRNQKKNWKKQAQVAKDGTYPDALLLAVTVIRNQ